MVKLDLEQKKDFFKEEVQSGFTVSSLRKEVWAVELDLLYKFILVCEKHGLLYFADGGTMLGAARHLGFIPWDDDIDVIMRRDDYTRLCAVAKDEFTWPYFFQTEETDKGSLRGHAQLRNSLTTGILVAEKDRHFPFNQGIFIDIFPFDNIVNRKKAQVRFRKELGFYKKLAFVWRSLILENRMPKRFFKKLVYVVAKKIACAFDFYFKKNPFFYVMQHRAQRFNRFGLEYMAPVCFEPQNTKNVYRIKDYKDFTYLPFESLAVRVPKNYKTILSNVYGNYQDFVVGKNKHGGVIFDTDVPYKRYL